MLANALAQRLSRYGIHYGWVIVAVTFLTALTTAGAVGVPGALILPLTKEFGWNTAQISSALAIRLLLYGLMAPFAAALIERYGVRRVVIIAITMIVAGLLLALAMSEAWHLLVLWGLFVGIGTGLSALVLSAIVSTRWFTARRGLVLGMLTASSATGQLVFLPLAAWLVERFGWRYALAPSVIGLLIAGLLVVLFMRDRPSDVGLAPYGEAGPRAGGRRSWRPPRPRLRSGAPSRCSARSRRAARSGFSRRLFSSAGSAPTASCRPISFRSASISACRRSPPPRPWR